MTTEDDMTSKASRNFLCKNNARLNTRGIWLLHYSPCCLGGNGCAVTGPAKMWLLFFKLIITPSPHNLTSASQQNTSKPSPHKKRTRQPLWGVSWDCLPRVNTHQWMRPSERHTNKFIYTLPRRGQQLQPVPSLHRWYRKQQTIPVLSRKRQVMKPSVIQFSVCSCIHKTDYICLWSVEGLNVIQTLFSTTILYCKKTFL